MASHSPSWRSRTSRISAGPPAGAAPEQAGREDAAAIRDEEVAGAEQIRQIGEAAVLDAARRAVEHQQPRRVALGERLLGNELGRQRVVVGRDLEVGVSHAGTNGRRPPYEKSFFWGVTESGTARPRCS